MSSNVTNVFPNNYVSLISKDQIHLENVSDNVVSSVKAINAKSDELEGRIIWKTAFFNKIEMVDRLKELNELGFLFAGGAHGWPPAEIVADLREKKLLKGNFKEVRWRGPGDWFVIER